MKSHWADAGVGGPRCPRQPCWRSALRSPCDGNAEVPQVVKRPLSGQEES
jgi:hypothetical protein